MTNASPETTEEKSPMATSLDSYLRGQYKEDRAFLGRLTNTIDEVIPIFYERSANLRIAEGAKTLVTSWPYAVVSGESPPGGGHWVSASTHCMILFALDAFGARKKDKYSMLLGKGFRPPALSSENEKGLKPVVAAAKKALVQVVNRSRGTPLVKSGTYGDDDPFTLTWLTEIVFRWIDCDNVPVKNLARCQAKIVAAAGRVLGKQSILRADETGFSEVTGSSFLKVRRLHLARAARRLTGHRGKSIAKKWIDENTPVLWKEFDDTIHRHLSYSSMGEQKFDPAELAFALEGALLLHPNWIGRSTIDEVFEALKLSRDRHPFWRPITPFLANDRGHILFLISIEVANSILRACEILQEREGNPYRFSQFEPHLRTYATWLLGEMEEIPDAGKPNLLGWRTEYEDEHDTIQLWHTSHVLIFLAHYAALLKRKIAASGLEAAGLQTRKPKHDDKYWQSEPLPSLATRVRKGDDDRAYAVLGRIRKHYIEPRKDFDAIKSPRTKGSKAQATPLYSMLLYGPPGTGKTTVAEQIAAELKRPLIVITVSDFLAAGAAEIENRAKGVFEVLRAQEDVIILFDEIDQFLLDRNSEFYTAQDDVFKFMTPGMLTKLQDLRAAENCIFIVATNYYERIDSAIKRRGRIDEHFLLCLPDQRQRFNLLKRFVKKMLPSAPKGDEGKKRFESQVRAAFRRTKIAEKTVLFGYGDLKHLVESKMVDKKKMGLESAKTLAAAVDAKKVESAVNLSGYRSRFKEEGPSPSEEFFLLVYLLAESNSNLSSEDKTAIRQVLECLFKERDFGKFLENIGIKEKVIRATVAKYLKDLIAKHKKERQEIAEREKTPKK